MHPLLAALVAVLLFLFPAALAQQQRGQTPSTPTVGQTSPIPAVAPPTPLAPQTPIKTMNITVGWLDVVRDMHLPHNLWSCFWNLFGSSIALAINSGCDLASIWGSISGTLSGLCSPVISTVTSFLTGSIGAPIITGVNAVFGGITSILTSIGVTATATAGIGVAGFILSIVSAIANIINFAYSTGIGGISVLALGGTMLNFLGTGISLAISAGLVFTQILTGVCNMFSCTILGGAGVCLNFALSLISTMNVAVMALHNLMMNVIATPFGIAAWATLLADIVPLVLQLVVLLISLAGVVIFVICCALAIIGVVLLAFFFISGCIMLPGRITYCVITIPCDICAICLPCFACFQACMLTPTGLIISPIFTVIFGVLIPLLYTLLDFISLAVLTAFNTLWMAGEDIWSFLMMLVNVAVLALLRLLADIVLMFGISTVVSFIFTAASHVLSLCESLSLSCCSSLTGGALGLGSTVALGEGIATFVVFLNRLQQYAPLSRLILYPLEMCAGIGMLLLAIILTLLNVLCYPLNFVWSNLYHYCCAPFVRPLGWS